MSGLSRLSLAKLGLAVAGILTFGAGIRIQNANVRWAGIGLVAVAWILRFAGARSKSSAPDKPQLPDETR